MSMVKERFSGICGMLKSRPRERYILQIRPSRSGLAFESKFHQANLLLPSFLSRDLLFFPEITLRTSFFSSPCQLNPRHDRNIILKGFLQRSPEGLFFSFILPDTNPLRFMAPPSLLGACLEFVHFLATLSGDKTKLSANILSLEAFGCYISRKIP